MVKICPRPGRGVAGADERLVGTSRRSSGFAAGWQRSRRPSGRESPGTAPRARAVARRSVGRPRAGEHDEHGCRCPRDPRLVVGALPDLADLAATRPSARAVADPEPALTRLKNFTAGPSPARRCRPWDSRGDLDVGARPGRNGEHDVVVAPGVHQRVAGDLVAQPAVERRVPRAAAVTVTPRRGRARSGVRRRCRRTRPPRRARTSAAISWARRWQPSPQR